MFNRAHLLLATTALLGGGIAMPAAAQDTTQNYADAPEGLGDIIVTAQRREENIQDVPISVTVIDDGTLEAITASGQDIRALSGRVPSLLIRRLTVRISLQVEG